MELDREKLLNTFVSESVEYLALLSYQILSLEANPRDRDSLQEVFRLTHNLKGSSFCIGLVAIPEFAHAVESVVAGIGDGSLLLTAELVTVLLDSVNALQEMVAEIANDGEDEIKPEVLALMERLSSWNQCGNTGRLDYAAAGNSSIDAPDLLEKPASTQPKTSSKISHPNSLRVDIGRADSILNLTGEIAIALGRLRQAIRETGDKAGQDLLEAYVAADSLYLQLQEHVTKMRMVPIEPLMRQFARTVRDTARSQGKLARLTIEAEDVEVDAAVIEHLRDPLAHMIRNFLGHGIELPEVRKSLGKDPCGRILMRAFQAGGVITIEISDDGAGMDPARILERALAMDLLSEGDRLSKQEILDLIFKPGFSTAEEISDLSGRGMGMDIVRRNVEAIRGGVTVWSNCGTGTTITLRLPLTLAIVEAFGVGIGEETYLIPVESVLECVDLYEASHNKPTGVISLRGEAIPYLRLSDHFGQTGSQPEVRESLVVVQNNGSLAGLVVDALYGASQAVMKPLGRVFRDVPGISGSTILGNGRVALILDIPSLLKKQLDLAAEAA